MDNVESLEPVRLSESGSDDEGVAAREDIAAVGVGQEDGQAGRVEIVAEDNEVPSPNEPRLRPGLVTARSGPAAVADVHQPRLSLTIRVTNRMSSFQTRLRELTDRVEAYGLSPARMRAFRDRLSEITRDARQRAVSLDPDEPLGRRSESETSERDALARLDEAAAYASELRAENAEEVAYDLLYGNKENEEEEAPSASAVVAAEQVLSAAGLDVDDYGSDDESEAERRYGRSKRRKYTGLRI